VKKQKTDRELKNIIEAALLVAGQPLTIERMAAMFPEDACPTREEIRAALKSLEADYEGRALELRQIDRAYRLQTRPKYSKWLSRLVEERPTRYSRALLETLSIIAYRQPVTRGDIEDIRGVAVSPDIIKTLLDRGWIREVGHREVPGHPALFGTTRAFLEYFNLSKLDDLPPLAELRDLAAIGAEVGVQIDNPPTSVPAPVQQDLLDAPSADADPPRDGDSNEASESEAAPAFAHASKAQD
jgi:segregation and condensation protein B